MSNKNSLKVGFKAPLKTGDTEITTVGCRANNPDICKNNGIPDVCAFVREDGTCHAPSKAWKKQFLKLSAEGIYETK